MPLYIKFTYGLEMHDQQNNLLASFYSDKLFSPVVCVEYCKSFKVLKEHISLGILNKILPFLTQTNCRSDTCTHECKIAVTWYSFNKETYFVSFIEFIPWGAEVSESTSDGQGAGAYRWSMRQASFSLSARDTMAWQCEGLYVTGSLKDIVKNMYVNYPESPNSLTTLRKHMHKLHDVLMVKWHYFFKETMKKKCWLWVNMECMAGV